MSEAGEQLSSMLPALLFLLAGVPLAALLERLGFFEAVASVMARRARGGIPVGALWALAGVTTAALNLDTTVVLLTPLYIRLARRAGTEVLDLALIPLLLAALASSVLPISNLTTLIVVDRFDLGVGDVVTHLALPSIVASAMGWLVYRRRYPRRLPSGATRPPDRRALAIGTAVVAGLLAGFVLGPAVGLHPWMVALAADAVLVLVTHSVPWRAVPVLTALGVAAVGAAVALVLPAGLLTAPLESSRSATLVALGVGGAALANGVNNLPALFVGLDGVDRMTWGMWAWLLGVNAGSVVVPIGALANLLWLRIARAEGVTLGLRRYVRSTVPIAVPAFTAALAVLLAEHAVATWVSS